MRKLLLVENWELFADPDNYRRVRSVRSRYDLGDLVRASGNVEAVILAGPDRRDDYLALRVTHRGSEKLELSDLLWLPGASIYDHFGGAQVSLFSVTEYLTSPR